MKAENFSYRRTFYKRLSFLLSSSSPIVRGFEFQIFLLRTQTKVGVGISWLCSTESSGFGTIFSHRQKSTGDVQTKLIYLQNGFMIRLVYIRNETDQEFLIFKIKK